MEKNIKSGVIVEASIFPGTQSKRIKCYPYSIQIVYNRRSGGITISEHKTAATCWKTYKKLIKKHPENTYVIVSQTVLTQSK